MSDSWKSRAQRTNALGKRDIQGEIARVFLVGGCIPRSPASRSHAQGSAHWRVHEQGAGLLPACVVLGRMVVALEARASAPPGSGAARSESTQQTKV